MRRATTIDRKKNKEVRRGVDVRENLSDREDRKVLKLFGQAERMSEEQMNKRV